MIIKGNAEETRREDERQSQRVKEVEKNGNIKLLESLPSVNQMKGIENSLPSAVIKRQDFEQRQEGSDAQDKGSTVAAIGSRQCMFLLRRIFVVPCKEDQHRRFVVDVCQNLISFPTKLI